MSGLKLISRILRRNQTDAEQKFWFCVRNRKFEGLKFKRQESIGPYIVDFFCMEKRLVVELDGGQHSENKYDLLRTEFIEGRGFLVKRYWNNEVLDNMDGVLSDLSKTLNTLTPALSPWERELR